MGMQAKAMAPGNGDIDRIQDLDSMFRESGIPPLLDRAEAAELLKISFMQLWRLQKKGLLSPLQARKGTKIIYSRRDIAAYLGRLGN